MSLVSPYASMMAFFVFLMIQLRDQAARTRLDSPNMRMMTQMSHASLADELGGVGMLSGCVIGRGAIVMWCVVNEFEFDSDDSDGKQRKRWKNLLLSEQTLSTSAE